MHLDKAYVSASEHSLNFSILDCATQLVADREFGSMASNEKRERSLRILQQMRIVPGFRAQFRVPNKRLKEIAKQGTKQMEKLSPQEVADYTE